MKMSKLFCILAMVAIGAMLIRCNSASPTSSPSFANVLLSEGFESDAALSALTFAPGWGNMSKSTAHAHSGKYSLTSDSNQTGIKEPFDLIADSIAGLQFYLMATTAEHINFFGALARSGSAWNGLYAILGLGISQSDSLMYVYQYAPNDSTNEQKCFAPLQFNKWYQCNVEFNFTTSVLTYSVDGKVVGTKNTDNMMMLGLFVTTRDNLGSQGPKGYYMDDVTIYKK